MNQYLRSVGLLIRKRRKLANLTLPELAAKAGISQGNLSKIENKPCNIGLDTLYKLSGALGVTIKDFLP